MANDNIIFIISDSLRKDFLGCYGYKKEVSPYIDKLASEGLVFDNAITQAPFTSSSIASIFTSLYPSEHKVVYYHHKLLNDFPYLTSNLKKAGYETAAFVHNPHISPQTGYRDFDCFYQGSKWFDILSKVLNKITKKSFIWWGNAKTLNKEVFKFLEKPRKKPLFLFLFYIDTHIPFSPPLKYYKKFGGNFTSFYAKKKYANPDFKWSSYSEEENKEVIRRYEAEINFFDEQVGLLLSNIEKNDSTKNSLIMFTSDHGEGFRKQSAGHGQLYEEGIRVPLILKFPNSSPKRINDQVSLIDLFPTILDYLELKIPKDISGKTFLPLIKNSENGNEHVLIENVFSRAIRTLKWKYINNKEGIDIAQKKPIKKWFNKPSEELYDLEKDSEEKNNLADESKDKLKEFQEILETYKDKFKTSKLKEKSKIKEIIKNLDI